MNIIHRDFQTSQNQLPASKSSFLNIETSCAQNPGKPKKILTKHKSTTLQAAGTPSSPSSSSSSSPSCSCKSTFLNKETNSTKPKTRKFLTKQKKRKILQAEATTPNSLTNQNYKNKKYFLKCKKKKNNNNNTPRSTDPAAMSKQEAQINK
jgi:hypothetical protein